jgi:hypothetical protein
MGIQRATTTKTLIRDTFEKMVNEGNLPSRDVTFEIVKNLREKELKYNKACLINSETDKDLSDVIEIGLMVIAGKIRESSNGLNGEKFDFSKKVGVPPVMELPFLKGEKVEKKIVETGSLTLRDFKRLKSSSTPKPVGKSNKQKLENLFREMLNKGTDEDKTLAEYIKERS